MERKSGKLKYFKKGNTNIMVGAGNLINGLDGPKKKKLRRGCGKLG